MSREKKLITDFLETYKFLPCLWDTKDKLYTSKRARNRAYELLTEKYKAIDEDATVDLIKKRLENMRAAYKREHKKVLASRVHGNGPEDEHKPSLWYYKYLRFLDNDASTAMDKPEYSSGDDDKKQIYSGLPKKRIKSSSGSAYILNKDREYFEEESDTEPVENNAVNISIQDSFTLGSDESESFGKTVGLQLSRLDDMQRNIAEKLISDVIYYARLNQLNTRTTINIGDDFIVL